MAELGNGEARLREARQPQSLTHPGEVSPLPLSNSHHCLLGW